MTYIRLVTQEARFKVILSLTLLRGRLDFTHRLSRGIPQQSFCRRLTRSEFGHTRKQWLNLNLRGNDDAASNYVAV